MVAAQRALEEGRSALDVVEIGIRPVEVDPEVRSVGVGGWPNLLGVVELDASIMDGRTLETGAVGAVKGFIHPISIARRVMEELPHVFLVGEGAERFAAEIGAERGETLTETARREWEDWMREHVASEAWQNWPDTALIPWARLTADPETAGGTTTFLARDARGDIAAGVSTCGWAFKYPGRLGDSPVIGAGSYADNRYGAAACTGMGELTIRAGTARSIVLYMKMGMSVEEACHEAARDLRHLRRRYRGGVTIHAIDAEGKPYVLAVGREKATYWIWMEGMAEPECRQAEVVDL
ncbi:MAG: N(4)-(beta-N-acetylglucosaminyl)-L-asparaginase [Anaerolineae bacterium]